MEEMESGQIVKFHTPLEGENPLQQYVLLEIHEDAVPPRAQIRPLSTGLSFPPINSVQPSELELMEVFTGDLLGHIGYVRTEDFEIVSGRIISVRDNKLNLNTSLSPEGVDTNLWVTIVSNKNREYSGNLIVRSGKE